MEKECKKGNVIQKKSYHFALVVIEVYKRLIKEQKEFVLSRQFLKSGTGIGANIEEAIGAQSKKDFISKMAIAYKEARETSYWIRLLVDSGYMSRDMWCSLEQELDDILKILVKIQVTASKNS